MHDKKRYMKGREMCSESRQAEGQKTACKIMQIENSFKNSYSNRM